MTTFGNKICGLSGKSLYARKKEKNLTALQKLTEQNTASGVMLMVWGKN